MSHDLSKFKIIGRSRLMQELGEWVHTAAPLWDTILITGERGTGKGLLAQAIHRLGPTKGAEMVVVDCAALHPATVESALFGHERGAFTGAVNRHIGFLEAAQGGTLFLDEISSLPLDIQSRFLRFLEEGALTRIGSTRSIQVKTRIVAATNRNLTQEVERERFLPDLHDRLQVLPVVNPPLRKREEDLVLLLDHFLEKNAVQRFTPEAVEKLRNYSFPGNVRELKNLCRRLSVFCGQQEITRQALEQNMFCFPVPGDRSEPKAPVYPVG